MNSMTYSGVTHGLRSNQILPQAAKCLIGNDEQNLKLDHVILYRNNSIADLDRALSVVSRTTQFTKMGSASAMKRVGEWSEFASICHTHGVEPYIGGGLVEDAMDEKNGVKNYMDRIDKAGITTVEVSNSDGRKRPCDYRREIQRIRKDCKTLLVEIGAKDDSIQTTAQWLDDLKAGLDLGADYIILEATAVGDCGIYNEDCEPRQGLMEVIIQEIPTVYPKLILEAPDHDQRKYWMQEMFGWSVRLGNIDLYNLAENVDLRFKHMTMDAIVSTLHNRLVHDEMHAIVKEVSAELHISPDTILFDGSIDGLYAEDLTKVPGWQDKIRHDLRVLFDKVTSDVIVIPSRCVGTYIL